MQVVFNKNVFTSIGQTSFKMAVPLCFYRVKKLNCLWKVTYYDTMDQVCKEE